jgi:NAD(P)-dependent dehydrogenase (short-subunit alcohol dehydrogenase family)
MLIRWRRSRSFRRQQSPVCALPCYASAYATRRPWPLPARGAASLWRDRGRRAPGRRSGPLEDGRAEVGTAVIPVVHDVSDLPAIPAFLASKAASFVHGTTIPVDGGAAVGF